MERSIQKALRTLFPCALLINGTQPEKVRTVVNCLGITELRGKLNDVKAMKDSLSELISERNCRNRMAVKIFKIFINAKIGLHKIKI